MTPTTTKPFLLAPLLNILDDIVIVVNEAHKVVFANNAAIRLWKKTRKEFIGKTSYDTLPQKQAALVWEKDERVFSTGKPDEFKIETRIAGHSRILKYTLLPFYDPATSRKLIVKIIKVRYKSDQNDPDPSTSASIAAPAALVRFLEFSPHVNIMWKDLNQKVLWLNETCARNLGFSQADLIGAQFEEAVSNPALMQKWAEEDKVLLRKKQPLLDIIETSTDEDPRRFRLDKIPFVDRDGEIDSILVIGLEIGKNRMPSMDPEMVNSIFEATSQKLADISAAVDNLFEKIRESQHSPAGGHRVHLMTSVIPYLEELKRIKLKGNAGGLIELIDRNLKKLTEPFAAKISSPLLKLSPIEQKVAHFIRDGKTNKEIAALLNVSKSTILTHRHHIRAKLGLKHQKINLRSYLSAQ